jgi:SNF2 family DNA or RNA helicase
MVERIVRDPLVFLGVDMGLGKTVSVLTAVADLLQAEAVSKVLVIAPLRVAENTWPDEIAGWSHLAGLKCAVLTGTEAERALAAASPAPVHIINRENVRWLYHFWKERWPYDMLVYDEASRLKGGKRKTGGGLEGETKGWALTGEWPAQATPQQRALLNALLDDEVAGVGCLTTQEACERADVGVHHLKKLAAAGAIVETKRVRPPSPPQLSEFGALCKARKRIQRVVLLSGTPAPNGAEDLWGPGYILDQGERLGASKNAFHARWFVRHPAGFGWKPRPQAGDEIMAALSDVMVGLRKEDYLDIPDAQHNLIRVKMTPKHLAQYRAFEEKLYSEEYDVEAVNSGVLTGKLLQFANGSMYREDGESVHVHDAKLAALESIIEEAAGEQVLVAYSFRFDLERIRKKFPKAIAFDEEPDFVRRWNNRDIGVGLAHPASIGHGLNLQHGGHIAVWYGLTWSLELYQQFNQRLPRSGQKNRVLIHHILTDGTEDERVYKELNRKGATQERLIDIIRLRPDHLR